MRGNRTFSDYQALNDIALALDNAFAQTVCVSITHANKMFRQFNTSCRKFFNALIETGEQVASAHRHVIAAIFKHFTASQRASGFYGHRHLDFYVVRIFLPLVIFVLVSWATFFLEDYRKRNDYAAANLLIFVAFNFAISGDLPRLGYMTFLDFILVSMFIITGLIIVFGRKELAERIDAYALKWIYPLSYVVVLSWAVYRFIYQAA